MKTSLFFEFKGFISSGILSSANIFGMDLGDEEVLFVYVSSETFSLGYFAAGVFIHHFQFGYVDLDCSSNSY